jgi:hypothetical protein
MNIGLQSKFSELSDDYGKCSQFPPAVSMQATDFWNPTFFHHV